MVANRASEILEPMAHPAQYVCAGVPLCGKVQMEEDKVFPYARRRYFGFLIWRDPASYDVQKFCSIISAHSAG
jgi:hypothetical protein